MRLIDVMTRPLSVVPETTPAAACVAVLHERRLRHLPVVDADGALVGLLTDYELKRRSMWLDQGLDGLVARQLQRDVQVVLPPETPLPQALRRLRRATQDAILVADEGRVPLGIFTEHDAMRLAAQRLPDRPLAREGALPLVDADRPALDVRSWMAHERMLHALCVRDERLVGVLSFRDVALEEDLEEHLTASDVASRPMASSRVLSGPQVAEVLHQRKIGCLPVVDPRWRPVGLTTRRDLMGALADALEHGAA